MTDTNMSSFFDELVRAKQAMETLPQIQTELAKAQGERDVIRDRFESLHDEHTRMTADLTAKEAALSDATFREQQLSDKLEMLLGTFKSVIGEASAVVDLIEPKPEPVIETVTQDQSATDPMMFTQTQTDAPGDGSAAELTTLPGTFPWESPKIGDAEDNAYMYAEPYGFTKPSEATVTPEVNPTSVHTDNTTAGNADTTTAPQMDGAPASPRTEGILTKPYWEKPTPTLWLDWKNSGGELAPWVKGMSDDQLRFAH